jgi:site-specific DNA recombinase
MTDVLAAIYARVSSEQQADEHTIASQVAALRARVAEDGLLVPADHEYLDEGYSGATLVRPALERVRDLIAAGGIDRLYVHSPDRLARRYAYQALLLDEFHVGGVEVVFLNRALSQSPEDELLLQVQGMMAEYERAKMLERSRRGKRHGAQTGVVSVLSGAPYGYRYVKKEEGGGAARFELMLDEARVVRQVFQWVGQERATIGEVVRRLTAAQEHTRTGRTVWDRTTVWDMLKNPAYAGMAAFGKTQAGPAGPRLRAQRGRPLQPRRAVAVRDTPPETWLHIPVPPLVDAAVFATVQDQLQENRRHARQGLRGARYLLQGLVCCAHCGYAFYGKAISPSARKHHPRSYAYYRCLGTDAYRFGGECICSNHQVRTDLLDAAVWSEACALLEQPHRLEQEYHQRLAPTDEHAADQTATELQRTKLCHGLTRLIDSYTEGFLEKKEFESRITRQRQRIAALDEQVRQLADAASLQRELRLVIGRLEDFAVQVEDGLEAADWLTRREIIRTLVSRVEIDHTQVNVMFRVPPDPFVTSPDHLDRGVLQHCRRGDRGTLRRTSIPLHECVILLLERGFQPALHVQEDPPLVGVSSYRSQHELMVNRVEEGSDVKIDHPILSPASLSADAYRLESRAPRSIAVRVRVKQRLHLWLKIQMHDRLSDSVRHRGHSENSDPLRICLRYFDCPHRRR